MMSRIGRYILGRSLTGFGMALAVISIMILLVRFVGLSRTLGGHEGVSASDILGLTLLSAPSIIQLLLPFVFLAGGIGAFVSMNRRSELIAMRAAGVSAWRFIRPSAAAAFVIGILAVVALTRSPRSSAPASRPTKRRSRPATRPCPKTSGCARATSTPRW